MTPFECLAFDLGAESGRLMRGAFDGERLLLDELRRFPNEPLAANGELHWNVRSLLDQVQLGLSSALQKGAKPRSISAVSWGLDYFLFKNGQPLLPVYHYRDPRTARGRQRLFSRVTWEELFSETGIQDMPINTSFQLAAEDPARLQSADFLLSVADGVNHLLGGRPVMEESMASTFQLYNPITRSWSRKLLDALELPARIFPEIVQAGTPLGFLNQSRDVQIIATCSHDTGAAVAAIPASHPPGKWAYISSGTWSLLGAEIAQPIMTAQARELNFTNEAGYGRTTRLLKNIVGLWLLQECRREWEREGARLDYAQLAAIASDAQPFRSLINPADPRFVPPGGMLRRIEEFCRETNQPVPRNPAEHTRCILESLALQYRRTLERLESVLGSKVEVLHIVGGGSKNDLLNQFAANATRLPVLAGPVEATALGNILVQAIAAGAIPSLDSGRKTISRSFDLREYLPKAPALWAEAYNDFCGL